MNDLLVFLLALNIILGAVWLALQWIVRRYTKRLEEEKKKIRELDRKIEGRRKALFALKFRKDTLPIWEIIQKIGAEVPDEEWEKLN